MTNPRPFIIDAAKALGFDAVGFAPPDNPPNTLALLQEFTDKGYHGDMAWLAEKQAVRAQPKTLWPEVKSAIVLGMNYGPATDPMAQLANRDRGTISVYAQNDDYHDVLKGRLKLLAQKLVSRHGGEVKVFVDTAPVMEKTIAAQSGIGWEGKHSCIVSREFGSWLFLGIIYTTLSIPADVPVTDHCGSCTRCLDICPTDAFDAAHRLDARKCISYLTIEHKGHIAAEFRTKMGNRIYGCDDCLAICPWNKFAEIAQESRFHARDALKAPELAELLQLDDAAFRALFRKSPIKRIGRDRFIRNVLIAAGNSADTSLLPHITALLTDPSPLVRAMAVWAVGRLAEKSQRAALHTHHTPQEKDADVLKEWQTALC